MVLNFFLQERRQINYDSYAEELEDDGWSEKWL